jgi:hypothetical protein
MKNQTSVILKLLPGLIFPMLMAALGIYMFVVSFSYLFDTRAFAQATSVVLIILSLAVIMRDALRSMKKAQCDTTKDTSTSAGRQIHPIIFALTWCVAFFILVLLVGFVIATPVWVCSLLLWNRASRLATVLIAIVLWAMVKLVLEYGLDTILFQGILFGDHLSRFW